MVATVIIASCAVLYLIGFVFFDVRRRKQGKKSFFAEESCDCKINNSKRLLAYYRKQKKRDAKKESA